MNTEYIEFDCLEANQPIGKLYIGIMNYDDLHFISYSDIRRLETGDEKREVETYSGIQRELSGKRVKEIRKYVEMIDATFPSSIILHIPQEDITYKPTIKRLRIPKKNNLAKVLDGQHRIAGFDNWNKPGEEFQLVVTIFVEMELEDQAIVFATINQTQTKVNKSLVADLFEFAKTRSPQKTAHNIVRALNSKPNSPFEGKIKILGTAIDQEKETITQATFTEAIIKYLSNDKALDRDTYKRGKIPPKFEGKNLEDKFFRNLFIDEKDAQIAQIIWNYFKAVENKWVKAWRIAEADMILNRTTGFLALMRFIKDAYLSLKINEIGSVPTVEEFNSIFRKIDLNDSDFNKTNYLPGSGGQSKLYKHLKEKSGL